MKKLYFLKAHSLIDVITNSSSELFVNGDKTIVEYFEKFFEQNVSKDNVYLREGLKFLTVKEFKKQNFDKDTDEIYIIEKIGDLKDDDKVITFYYSSEDIEYYLLEFLTLFNFKNIWE